MNLNDLSPELKAKARECKNADELVKLAEAEGMEISDEELEGISGGFEWGCSDYEPNCGDFS